MLPAMSFLTSRGGRENDPRFPVMAMAPEGTYEDGRRILRFRTGAFVAGDPVLRTAKAPQACLDHHLRILALRSRSPPL